MTGFALARRGAIKRRGGAAPTSWAQTNEVATLTDEWSSVSDPDGQFALTTTAAGVRTGSKGLALTFKGAAASPSLLTKTGLGFTGTSWRYDLYWKVAGALTFSSYDLTLLEGYAGATLAWRIKMTQDRSFYFERNLPAYAAGTYGVGAFAVNTWTKVSVRQTGGGTAAGAIDLLVNDVSVQNWSALDYTGTWRPDKIQLGPVAVTATGTMYFDDGLVVGS